MAATGAVADAEALLAADPSLASAEGGPHRWPPLLYAAYSRLESEAEQQRPGYSTLEVARLLLAHGADPDAGYLWDGSAVFTALTGAFGGGEEGLVNQPPHRRSEQLARLLLDAGADPNDSQTLYNRQFTPADDHLELLLEYGLGTGSGGPWRERTGQVEPARMVQDQLTWAAAHNLPDRVRLLLAHGVPPAGRSYELAMLAGSPTIADMLLSAGAEPVEFDPQRQFVAAAMAADRAGVDRLTTADPQLAGRVAAAHPDLITRAVSAGRPDTVRLLADLGFDVNACGDRTALHEAAWAGDLPMVEVLIALGADPSITDRSYLSTPAGFAAYNHQKHVVDFLAELGG